MFYKSNIGHWICIPVGLLVGLLVGLALLRFRDIYGHWSQAYFTPI